MSPRDSLQAALRDLQGDHCGICGDPPNRGESFVIDHDHDSGMVRGLLCRSCNIREGQHSCRNCLPGECPVEIWRRSPAVSWVGWTERYEYDDRRDSREMKLERPWAPTWAVAAAEREVREANRHLIEGLFADRRVTTSEVIA